MRHREILLAVVHAYSKSADLHDPAPDQGKDNVDVMDHQIHHHTHIHRARPVVGPNAAGLDKYRLTGQLSEPAHRRLEALHVTDQQYAILPPCQLYQCGGFCGRGGHRFFDQHMTLRFQKRAGDLKV